MRLPWNRSGGRAFRRVAKGRRGAVDLGWVDGFVERIRPYVFVREEDAILVQMPNRAQRLNAEGAALLAGLLRGRSIRSVERAVGGDPSRLEDIGLFLFDVKRFLEGSLHDRNGTRAVEASPFALGFSELPILSEVALTYRCNLRCTFCYAGCNCTANPAGDVREMTGEEILVVLGRIRREAKVPSVSFTGGEAMLRDDVADLVRGAKHLGLRVNLITNGTRIGAAEARELASSGLDSAQVSLEGATAGTHDAVTGVKGSYAKTVAAVGFLRGAGIPVHTNTTLHRANLSEAIRMPRFVREGLGLERFSMNLVIPTGSAALDGRLVVRYEEIGSILDAILAESRREGIEFLWYSPTPMCLFNPIAHGLGNKGCSACDGLLSVAANGDVLPCSSYDDPIGNLVERDFRSIWGSERARFYREKRFAREACRGCEDFAACHGACPLYWRHAGYGELDRTTQEEVRCRERVP
jgi:radical SAM protein with 4Fe4S-binding SPASM domain